MKRCIRLFFILLACFCLPSVSFAHSVYIFAWVDGTQICTESYFTQSSKVRGGEVIMADLAGNVLAKGISGDDGLLCLPLPAQAQTLEFSVLAGSGHRGSFTLEEKELAGAISTKVETGEQSIPTGQEQCTVSSSGQPSAQVSNSTGSSRVDASSEELLRRIVQEELQKQLSPMRQYLAEKLEDKTPGSKEIIGGIGWLLGLGSLGFWLSQRRKKR